MKDTTAIAELPGGLTATPRAAASPLRSIEPRDRNTAIRLLTRGFPHTVDAFWRRCLDRQIAVQEQSLGYFLDGDEGPVGLMLMLRSKRRLVNGAELEIANLSSWYVDRAHRRRTVQMLRQLAADRSVVLTALTAASQVHSMSATIGGSYWSTGMILASAAPFAALPGARATLMLPFRHGRSMLSPEDEAILDWHAADGHVAAVLVDGDVAHPLIFRVLSRRGLRFAQLIFAPSRTAVLSNLPIVTRFLARHGAFVLSIDGDREMCPRGAYFRVGRPRFWRGPIERDRLDYAYSELVLFGVS
jgi:hypothetical protein